MTRLYIIRGLPGSGKSTLARELVSDGIVDRHHEADDYFIVNGEYRFYPSLLPDAHSTCRKNITDALWTSARGAVVANTFTTWKEIVEYLDIAFRCGLSCSDISIVEKTGDYGSIHDVPSEAIAKMRVRWLSRESFLLKFAEHYGFAFEGSYDVK